MKEIFEQLKTWLKERQSNYVDHNSWFGDTESGFHTIDEFDFDKLCAEIDAFGEELRKRNK